LIVLILILALFYRLRINVKSIPALVSFFEGNEVAEEGGSAECIHEDGGKGAVFERVAVVRVNSEVENNLIFSFFSSFS
jgi:hypothetical protein